MSQSEELENQKKDWAVSVSKGVLGAVPLVGGLLGEVVGWVIPNQRMDRISRYVAQLEEKLGQLDKEFLSHRLTSPETIDLLEDSFFQAARALIDERMKQIAEVVKQGVTEERIKVGQCKRVLQILGDLTDFEILLLRAYALHWNREHPFIKENIEILMVKPAYIGAPQEILDAYFLHENYKSNLARLGLLKPNYEYDMKTKMPTFDSMTHGLKIRGYDITGLGRLVISTLDGFPDDEKA